LRMYTEGKSLLRPVSKRRISSPEPEERGTMDETGDNNRGGPTTTCITGSMGNTCNTGTASTTSNVGLTDVLVHTSITHHTGGIDNTSTLGGSRESGVLGNGSSGIVDFSLIPAPAPATKVPIPPPSAALCAALQKKKLQQSYQIEDLEITKPEQQLVTKVVHDALLKKYEDKKKKLKQLRARYDNVVDQLVKKDAQIHMLEMQLGKQSDN